MTNTDLRGAVEGRVLLPGDDGFEPAAKPWNLSEQRVAAVVEAADAADVAAVVRYAVKAGLTVSAQPSGHGATGDADGVILLRTGRLRDIEVRPGERLARVGAGVTWGEALAEIGPHGLTGLAGSSPIVSVTGYTLGGGVSWFSRAHGLAADSVRSFEVVRADGEPATVTAASDPDLFWALRGGGGDFALVTAIEFGLYPAPSLYGGRVMWPGHRAREVFEVFRHVTADAPAELAVWFNRLQFPGAPAMVALDAAFLGEESEGRALLAALDKIGDPIADKRGPLAVADLGTITAEPTDPVPARSKAELLTGLDDAAVDVLLDAPMEPLVGVQVRHLGGALAATRPDAGPSGPITEPYLLYLLGVGFNPQMSEAVGAVQERFAGELGASGRKPYTMLARGERAAAAFSERDLARLRDIKRAADPHGVLRANFPVLA
ncbi:FAD-binding oxidoreductase [Nonomuraea insulae]|uniref:FAD-binding oxidoreductase n=1 Tax=Nonomuraea insulae TaxID=1616787 RepID=A0ABW1DAZ1_9ACTN